MYVCGPTVYGPIHLGNARPVAVFDMLFRLLRRLHGEVAYARNITDIDDKIIRTARENGEDPSAIARKFEREFHADIAQLNALPPTAEPRATENIGEMQKLVATLLENGNAYEAENHVLFSVSSCKNYGALSNRGTDEMLAGARVEVAPFKRHPADFVLWKPAADSEPGWASPWGRGRPGWHLECSAMARAHLGEILDIHGGGQDLIFPHHENELAQSGCAHQNGILARFWVHNGHLTLSGEKMAKSVGNIVSLREALLDFPGEAARYALLSAHYRKPLDWTPKSAGDAKAALNRLYLALARGGESAEIKEESEPPVELVRTLCEDLNTPAAFALLHEMAHAANRARRPAEIIKRKKDLLAAGKFMGFFKHTPSHWLKGKFGESDEAAEIERQIEARNEARRNRNFTEADKIRDDLAHRGIVLEDSADGTKWRKK